MGRVAFRWSLRKRSQILLVLAFFCSLLYLTRQFQRPWYKLSLSKADRVLKTIQQKDADQMNWPFLSPSFENDTVDSYIRYGSADRVPMPHRDSDPLRFQSQLQQHQFINSNDKIFFINGHAGTSDDFRYLSHQLGFEYIEFSPRPFWYYGLNQRHADWLDDKGALGDILCRSFDTVVVGDTIPDARFLLQWIDRLPLSTEPTSPSYSKPRSFSLSTKHLPQPRPQSCQIKKIIMMTTNRFDFGVKESKLPAYYDLVRRVSQRGKATWNEMDKFPQIIWTANNPFDIEYANELLGEGIVEFHLIRSFGYSTIPVAKPFPPEITQLPVMFNHYDETRFIAWLKRNGINVAVFPRNYGGPTSVSQFKAFIDFPYQASTMKMYENILYGVVTLVPSKRLYVEELEGYIIEGFRVKNWENYVEYWYKDLADLVYTFDSIQELKAILSRPVLDPRNIRERGTGICKQMNQESLEAWKWVLFSEYEEK